MHTIRRRRHYHQICMRDTLYASMEHFDWTSQLSDTAHTMPFFVSLFVIHWSGLSGAKLYSIRIVFINWQKAQYVQRAWNSASDCARKSIVNNSAADIENGVYLW